MPETFFDIRWPDDSRDSCYSPSSIIAAHLDAHRTYTVEAFVLAARSGLTAASERVRQVYGGLSCFRAKAQLAAIEAKAGHFETTEIVCVEGIGSRTAPERVSHG